MTSRSSHPWPPDIEVIGEHLSVAEREHIRQAAQRAIEQALQRMGEQFNELARAADDLQGVLLHRTDPHGIPEDTYTHLVALAQDGDEAVFKDYARMVGVPAESLDSLWIGTQRRVRA